MATFRPSKSKKILREVVLRMIWGVRSPYTYGSLIGPHYESTLRRRVFGTHFPFAFLPLRIPSLRARQSGWPFPPGDPVRSWALVLEESIVIHSYHAPPVILLPIYHDV